MCPLLPAMALHTYPAAATLAASSLEGGDFGGLDAAAGERVMERLAGIAKGDG